MSRDINSLLDGAIKLSCCQC